MKAPRIFFWLSDLEKKIIAENMKEHGLEFEKDFDKYIQKTLSHEMEKAGFKSCTIFKSKVKRSAFAKSLPIKKMDFIVNVANENSTTLAAAISILLIKGYKKQDNISP